MRFERIVCAIAGHKYVVQRVFSPTGRQVGCTRCGREWGMNDSVRAFIPWDGELEQLYRDIGQWPGQTPNAISHRSAACGASGGLPGCAANGDTE